MAQWKSLYARVSHRMLFTAEGKLVEGEPKSMNFHEP